MSSPEYLKSHYDSLETEVLLDIWSRGGQLDWAEKLLWEELKRRDVADDLLKHLELSRQQLNAQIAEQQERFQLRAMGGWIALFLGGTLAGIFSSVLGWRGGLITFAVVLSGYGVLLARIMRHLGEDVRAGDSSELSVVRGVLQIFAVFGVASVCVWVAFAGKA